MRPPPPGRTAVDCLKEASLRQRQDHRCPKSHSATHIHPHNKKMVDTVPATSHTTGATNHLHPSATAAFTKPLCTDDQLLLFVLVDMITQDEYLETLSKKFSTSLLNRSTDTIERYDILLHSLIEFVGTSKCGLTVEDSNYIRRVLYDEIGYLQELTLRGRIWFEYVPPPPPFKTFLKVRQGS